MVPTGDPGPPAAGGGRVHGHHPAFGVGCSWAPFSMAVIVSATTGRA